MNITRTYLTNEKLLVGGVLLLACVIRFVCFVGIIGSDDLNYTRVAYAIATGTFSPVLSHQGTRMGISLPVAALFKCLGVHEFSTILYPFFCFLLILGMLLYTTTTLLGKSAGIVAGLLYTFLPLEMFHATILLPDLPSATCIALCGVILHKVYVKSTNREQQETGKPPKIDKKDRGYLFLGGLILGWAYLIRETSLFFGVFIAGYMIYNMVRYKRFQWSWFWFGLGFLTIIGIEMCYYSWSVGNPFHRFLSAQGGKDPNYMDHLKRYFYGQSIPEYVLLDRLRVIFFVPDFGFYYFFALAGIIYGIQKRMTRVGYFIGWFLTIYCLYSFTSVNLSRYIPLRSVPRYFLALSFPGVLIIAAYLQETTHILSIKKRRELYPFLLSLLIPWILLLIITLRWFSRVRMGFLIGIALFGGSLFFDRSRTWLRNRVPQHYTHLFVPMIFLYILLLPGIYMAAKGERPRQGITCERDVYHLLESPLTHTIYTDSRTESILEYFYQYQLDDQILQFDDADVNSLNNTYVIANWERLFFLNRVFFTPVPDFLYQPPSSWILRAQIGGEVNPCLIYEVP